MSYPFGFGLSPQGPCSPYNPPHPAPTPTPAMTAWRFQFGTISHNTHIISLEHKATWRQVATWPGAVWNNAPIRWALIRGAAATLPVDNGQWDETEFVFGRTETCIVTIICTSGTWSDPTWSHVYGTQVIPVPHDPYGSSLPPLRIARAPYLATQRAYPA